MNVTNRTKQKKSKLSKLKRGLSKRAESTAKWGAKVKGRLRRSKKKDDEED